jgi:hypothetical protein
MKETFFWQAWSAAERRMAYWALGILLLTLLFFVSKIINPLEQTIHWDVLSELSDIPVVVDILPLNGWQFGVTIPSFLTTEQFVASPMDIDSTTLRVFGVMVLLGLCLVLTAVSALPRFWYLGGMTAFILLVAACRLETLSVFGEDSRLLYTLIVLAYGGVSYYLHAFRSNWGVAIRMLVFSGITASLVLLVALMSPVSEPFLTAVVFSYSLWLPLSVGFLLMSATEIMAGLVWLSTSGKTGKSSLVNFLVISTFYLLNLVLLFLTTTHKIEWNLFMVSPVLLAIIAGVLGIWGFKKRLETTGLLSSRTAGFWLYLGLFIIALSFAGFAAGTSNDPALEVLEDMVIEGQLAMSVLFLFYMVINFLPLFRQGLAVHKVMYKPLRFGLTQTRLLGFTGLIFLLSTQGLLPVYQAVAGYFNGLGDLYTQTKEYTLAEQYYKMALQQEYQNHKSNYALASLALRQDDKTAAAYYFKQATLKNPSPQAYVGLGNVLAQENLFFDAVYSLQEGINRFPESSELLNNLGTLYSRTNVADSAYYYFDRAQRVASNDDVPSTNLLAIWAKSADLALLDSLAASASSKTYPSWQANWLTVQSLRQQYSPIPFQSKVIREDSLLNVSGLAYLVNYSLNQARYDTLPIRLIPKIANQNPLLSDDLLLASLYPEFYSGNKIRAIEILQALVDEEGEKAELYRKILGHWLLQLGLYEQALDLFGRVNGPEGLIGQILSNTFLGREAIAGVLIERLNEQGASAVEAQLRSTLSSGFKPSVIGDSLLRAAQAQPSALAYQRAVRANPFDGRIISVAAMYMRQQKQVAPAYQVVVNALRFNQTSPLIWEQYALLSVEQGLLGQGEEGAAKVRLLASPADYQSFVSRYQPLRALIEKQREEFR